jgi:hypothetical protein
MIESRSIPAMPAAGKPEFKKLTRYYLVRNGNKCFFSSRRQILNAAIAGVI